MPGIRHADVYPGLPVRLTDERGINGQPLDALMPVAQMEFLYIVFDGSIRDDAFVGVAS